MATLSQMDVTEDLAKLGTIVQNQIDQAAQKTHLSIKELMEIMEEVNIVKLHEALDEAARKISYAVDLTPVQIYEVFTDHRDAPLEDLVKRLQEKSALHRTAFA